MIKKLIHEVVAKGVMRYALKDPIKAILGSLRCVENFKSFVKLACLRALPSSWQNYMSEV